MNKTSTLRSLKRGRAAWDVSRSGRTRSATPARSRFARNSANRSSTPPGGSSGAGDQRIDRVKRAAAPSAQAGSERDRRAAFPRSDLDRRGPPFPAHGRAGTTRGAPTPPRGEPALDALETALEFSTEPPAVIRAIGCRHCPSHARRRSSRSRPSGPENPPAATPSTSRPCSREKKPGSVSLVIHTS